MEYGTASQLLEFHCKEAKVAAPSRSAAHQAEVDQMTGDSRQRTGEGDHVIRHGIIAAIACLTLYLLTIPGNHSETEDAFDFAQAVRTAPWAELIHPHHLAYLPAARLLYATGVFP